jgi:hypothetical protein
MKAIVYTLEEAVERDWMVPPTYLETCGEKNVLHFRDGSAIPLDVPVCPCCELELEGSYCPRCEEEVEL